MPQLCIETVDDNLLFERIESFGGGMDGFTRSTLLGQDVNQYLENCLVEQNLEARTRPGADALGSQTVDGGAAGTLQGLAYFDKPGTQRVFTAKGGTFYKWDNSNWTTAAGFTIDPAATFVAAQGIDTLLITDGTQNLKIWDGASFTDVGNAGPTGAGVVFWAVGRMWACGFPGTAGPGTESDAVWPSNLLQFGANGWLRTNSFRVGGGEGDPVIAGALVPTSASSSFLIAILKRNSTWLVNADPTQNPANWQQLLIGPGTGCVGKRALCQFGNDLLFMSRDGVRSVRKMQSAAGQYELSPPISQPMQPYIDRINWTVATVITAVKYKELVLFAVPLDSSTVNNYVLVYNGRLQKWVGVWTGWNPIGMTVTKFNNVQQLVVADTLGQVNLWKDGSTQSVVTTYTDNSVNIPTRVWTRACVFQDMINPKESFYAETRFTDGVANVTVTALLDNVQQRSWVANLVPTGPALGVALNVGGTLLPFQLGVPKPVTVRRGLRGLPQFNELYLKIESTQGWWKLRNVTLGAFLNVLKNEGSS